MSEQVIWWVGECIRTRASKQVGGQVDDRVGEETSKGMNALARTACTHENSMQQSSSGIDALQSPLTLSS